MTGRLNGKLISTTEVAQMVRAELKEKYPECKFSVTSKYFSGGSELAISLMEAPFDVFMPGTEEHWDRGYAQLNRFTLSREAYDNAEGCCNGAILSRKAWDVLSHAVEIANKSNWDNSDIMTDYFDVGFYLDINVGKWDKPFTRRSL